MRGQVREIQPETTMSSVHKLFESQDILFKSTDRLLNIKVCEAFQTDTIERSVKEIGEKPYISKMKDLLRAGLNPNAKEKCGITPLIISVILKRLRKWNLHESWKFWIHQFRMTKMMSWHL